MVLVCFYGFGVFLWHWCVSVVLVCFCGIGMFLWYQCVSVVSVCFCGIGVFLWYRYVSVVLVCFCVPGVVCGICVFPWHFLPDTVSSVSQYQSVEVLEVFTKYAPG